MQIRTVFQRVNRFRGRLEASSASGGDDDTSRSLGLSPELPESDGDQYVYVYVYLTAQCVARTCSPPGQSDWQCCSLVHGRVRTGACAGGSRPLRNSVLCRFVRELAISQMIPAFLENDPSLFKGGVDTFVEFASMYANEAP